MDTVDLKEKAIGKIKKAGYGYAKNIFDNWDEYYCQDDDDIDSHYKKKDEKGRPNKNNFSEQVGEESYHNYCDGDNNYFFEYIGAELSEDEKACFEEGDYIIYEIFDEGLSEFIEEIYK